MTYGQLPPEGQSLTLDRSLRCGLVGMTVVASCSLVPSVTLFLYICFKLLFWKVSTRARRRPLPYAAAVEEDEQRSRDYTLGIDGVFTRPTNNTDVSTPPRALPAPCRDNESADLKAGAEYDARPNQFLILILNLFLADIHQSLAFALNLAWLRDHAIQVGTPTCFLQGLLVSVGDLASSTFITVIAVHTYLSVVAMKKIPQKRLYMVIAAAWCFVYLVSCIPIAATRNGASSGGFFVRAGTWCWINNSYETLRLVTHYLFIFIALFTTTALYIIILLTTRRRTRALVRSGLDASSVQGPWGTSRAFLMYPFIYVTCTLPLAVGRVSTMAGASVPLPYLAVAGAMMAANGFFDCLLFGTTRRAIIFGSREDVSKGDVGLDTFAFMKTPRDRLFGNMIWVQGGRHHHHGNRPHSMSGASEITANSTRWGQKKPWGSAGGSGDGERRGWASRLFGGPRPLERVQLKEQNSSREALRRPAATIRMNTVTTVVVEETDSDKEQMVAGPPHFYWRSSDARSVKSEVMEEEEDDEDEGKKP